VHAAAYCHTRDATQRCQFGELTPLSCMTKCCSVHKSALTYKEIIFSTFSNQQVICICICLISCTESETYAHVVLRDGGPVFRGPLCIYQSLHIPGDSVPIIRRNNCVYATLGTCFSVWMTVWYVECTPHTRQSSMQNNKYQLSHKHSCLS